MSSPAPSSRSVGSKPAQLGTLEAQIMDLLWSSDASTVRELIAQIPSDPAYTTVATVLTNLRGKGLVCTRKDGHATRYIACVRREEHAARIMEHAMNASGDPAGSMMHFVSLMSDTDIELLRSFLHGRGRDTEP